MGSNHSEKVQKIKWVPDQNRTGINRITICRVNRYTTGTIYVSQADSFTIRPDKTFILFDNFLILSIQTKNFNFSQPLELLTLFS